MFLVSGNTFDAENYCPTDFEKFFVSNLSKPLHFFSFNLKNVDFGPFYGQKSNWGNRDLEIHFSKNFQIFFKTLPEYHKN